MTERWDRHFLDLAAAHAKLSKDPTTKVGAVIVGTDREILSAGFNGFARGIQDLPSRLADRPEKLRLMVHAETNAILAAARIGTRLKGSTIYTTLFPCVSCAMQIIQAGIIEVVSHPIYEEGRWCVDQFAASCFLREAGVAVRGVFP